MVRKVERLKILDLTDRIAKKSKLKQKDIDEISKKIKKETFNELNYI